MKPYILIVQSLLVLGLSSVQGAEPGGSVGNPARPATLAEDLAAAYKRGIRDLTIAPGTYRLPATGKESIALIGWHDATIHAKDVTVIFDETAHRPLLLLRCDNVTIEGATLQFAGISCTQGRVKAIGTDAKGPYYDWQIDAGYPTDIDPAKCTYDVIDAKTRLIKVGTGDAGVKEAERLGPGLFRLRQVYGGAAGIAAGDWLVTRAPAAAASFSSPTASDARCKTSR